MKIIGFSSGGVGHESNVDGIVKAIMDKSGLESEFVKLTDLTYSGCKGCVQLCAVPQVCRLQDDLFPYYQKIKEADAVVLGTPVYMKTYNAIMHSFIERFFGYRHVTFALQDKPFVSVVCGHRKTDTATEELHGDLSRYVVTIVDAVQFISKSPPCMMCGRHRECSIGGLYNVMGEAARTLTIPPDLFCKWQDNSETVIAIDSAVAKLKRLLFEGRLSEEG